MLSSGIFGFNSIFIQKEEKEELKNLFEKIIVEYNVGIFLFGTMNLFDNICYDIITDLKVKYPYIKRVYITAKDQSNSILYHNQFFVEFDEVLYLKELERIGKSFLRARNKCIIDRSDICFFYYNEFINLKDNLRMDVSYRYAFDKRKIILNYFNKKSFNMINLF